MGGTHIDTSLRSNMIKFYQRTLTHDKQVIRVASNNIITKKNTTMGYNASLLMREAIQLGLFNKNSNFLDVNSIFYKRLRKYAPISEDDKHKVPIMIELLKIRGKELYIDDDHFSNDDMLMTINELAVN